MNVRSLKNVSSRHVDLCWSLYLNCTENGRRKVNQDHEFCHEFICQCSPLKNNSNCLENEGKSELPNVELPTALLVVFILIAVSSFLANGFVCLVYLLSREIRTAKHYFMFNLGIADILIAVLVIPFYLTHFVDHESKTLCQIGSMVDVLCCTSSIISFTMISAERFVAVKYPLRYHTIVSRKRCLFVLTLAWTYSIAFSLASWIPVGKFDMNHCVFFSDIYIIFTTFASFVLPLFTMLVAYGWIYKVAKYQADQINNSLPRETNRVRREFKAAKTLTLIIGVFVVCWLPFFVYIWVYSLYNAGVPARKLNYAIQIVRYLNGLANPFIYVRINREFRRSTLKLLKRIIPHRIRYSNDSTNDFTQSTDIVLRKISCVSTGGPAVYCD